MKFIQKIFCIVAIISIIFVGFVNYTYSHTKTSIDYERLNDLSAGWKIELNDEEALFTNLPYKMPDGYNTATLSKYLDSDFAMPQSITVATTHQYLRVFIDKTEIYSYGFEKLYPLAKSKGSVNHIIQIPSNSNGCVLKLIVYNNYENQAIVLSPVKYALTSRISMSVFMDKMPVIVVTAVAIIISLAILFLSLVLGAKKRRGSLQLLYLAQFSFCIIIWSTVQTGILQFFFGNSQAIYFIDLLSLSVCPIPFMGYLDFISVHYNKVFKSLAIAEAAIALTGIVLQVAQVVDFYYLLPLIHLTIIIAILIAIICEVRESYIYKNKRVKEVILPIFIMACAGVFEIAMFVATSETKANSYFMLCGVLFMTTYICIITVRDYYIMMNQKEKTEYLLKLADVDMLTGILNRNAYEKQLQVLTTNIKLLNGLTYILIDINNLKKINDEYGHHYGDQAIKTTSICMKEVFGKESKCYRIGGDEFVCMSYLPIYNLLDEYSKLVKKYDKELPFPFSVAYGCATYDESRDADILELSKLCDRLMYTNKSEIKEKNKHSFIE